MWNSLTASEEEWRQALSIEGESFPSHVVTATANCLCAAKQFNEVFVGGDDSPCLLQVLAAPDGDDGETTDVMASVLLPEDEVQIAYSARGEDVKTLLASFWRSRPSAPTLLQHDGAYKVIMCKLPDLDWSAGPLSAKHVQNLQNHEDLMCETLQIYVPGESAPLPAQEPLRAATLRPASMLLADTNA